MKYSFGRVIEIKEQGDKYPTIVVRLALSLMTNPDEHEQDDHRIAHWNPKECKRRSNTWLRNKIDAFRLELTECLTGE